MTDAASAGNQWRVVIAALANPDMRRLVALLELGEDPEPFLATLSPSRRRHVVAGLVKAGLVGDELRLETDAFAALLAADAPRRRTGVDRFLRDGRISTYPAKPSEREELLRWVAARALGYGEVLDEKALTERLREYTDDPAVLRRYLIDAQLVARRADGSEYARVEAERGISG